jgi:hypothetical protein
VLLVANGLEESGDDLLAVGEREHQQKNHAEHGAVHTAGDCHGGTVAPNSTAPRATIGS